MCGSWGLQRRLHRDKSPESYLELKNPTPGWGREAGPACCTGEAPASWPAHFSSTTSTPTPRLGNVAGCSLSLLERVPKPQTLPRTHVTISWTNRKRSTSKPRKIKQQKKKPGSKITIHTHYETALLSPALVFQKLCCLPLENFPHYMVESASSTVCFSLLQVPI